MKKSNFNKVLSSFLALVLLLQPFFTGAAANVSAEEGTENPFETLTDFGNEVNEIVEQDGKTYARLGTGEGNDNNNKMAAFSEVDGEVSQKGTINHTFTLETNGEDSRFGVMPYFVDTENFVFIGYDDLGWFYEYKVDNEGNWLQERPNVDLPEKGQVYEIEVKYDGLTFEASLNGEDLFGEVTLDNAAEALLDGQEALKLGRFEPLDTQVLIDLGIPSEGEDGGDGEVTDPEPEEPEEPRDPVDIDVSEFSEGDFKVIGGDAEVEYNEDGSATFVSKGTAKGKIVYDNVPEIKNAVFEAEITPDRDLTRFGQIFRVQDESKYLYVGTGDSNDQYFREVFNTDKNHYTGMTEATPLEKDKTYQLKVRYLDDIATFYLNDEKVNAWSLEGEGASGHFGFEKSRGDANVTISNVKVTEIAEAERPDTEEVVNTLASDYMDVTIDEVFPRVIEYNVGDKVMDGQEESAYGFKVNGLTYYPEVTFEEVNDSEALYTLEVEDEYEGLDATFKVRLAVEDNKVIYTIEELNNELDAKIETVEFSDLNFISVNSGAENAEARFADFSGDATKTGDTTVAVDADMDGVGSSSGHYVTLLSNDELSASIWTSSEVDGYKNLIANRYENENGDKAVGIGSNTLYHHRDFMAEAQEGNPTIKIAIAEDLNGDGKADWQDAGIAYRDIMHEIKGANDVNNLLGTRIAMNFGSQAQQPFLKTLDNIKKVALATDGLGQAVILKGYGNEGHDSAHPDYGDVGERMGGEEDLTLLIDEAHKLNTEIGIHINAQETYPEADAFNDDFIEGPGNLGWGWIDQGYTIDKIKDLASGTRQERLDELQAVAPGLDFVYLDVWYQDQWESNRIVEQFYDMDLRLATEFGTAMPNHATWTHWATDKTYGGKESKGINSEVMRFISNHQKDSFVLNEPNFGGSADNPLLGGAELAGFEGWQSDKNFDNFMFMTFNTNISTKFLQKYYVTNWETVEGDMSETNLEKEIKLQDPNGLDEVVVTRKEDSRERIIELEGNVVLDGNTYLIPWKEEDFSGDSGDFEKLYHWNLDGGETTWTLPESLQEVSKVDVYALTDQGRGEKEEVTVVDGQVTLNAEAETPYVVIFDESEVIEIGEWSTGAHVYDTGFNSGTIEDDHTTVAGDKDAVSVKRTDQKERHRNLSSGDYKLNIVDPEEDTSVTREITDLVPGEDYVAEVYVENKSDVKASIEVTDAKEDVSNYTLRSLQKNYVKADSHASNDGYNSKMQRIQVSFTAATDKATLTLSREAGEGIAVFDDIRIVQKSLDNQASSAVFKQGFETVVQGIYPFVIGNTENVEDNRIHLSEKNDPYTQRGWADAKIVDDVIEGDWSIKTNTGNEGLLYRTIPQHLRFEAGDDYKVAFDYQTTADQKYRLISGDQENDARNINDVQELQINELLANSVDENADLNDESINHTARAEVDLKGSENGQSYIGIFSDGVEMDGHTGKGIFILDNLLVVNVSEFAREIEDAKEIKNDDDKYSEESFKALQDAIAAAEALDEDAEIDELSEASIALQAAVDGLKVPGQVELEKAVEDAQEYLNNEDKYTADSFAAFRDAMQAAADAIASQDPVAISKALEDLEAAIKGLEERVDVSDLADLINDAKAHSNDDNKYTADSFAALQDAIADAEAALETVETEEALNDAVAALQAAINGLEETEEPTDPEPEPEPEGVDVSGLEDLIKDAKAHSNDKNKYTDKSFAALQDAIAAAEAALETIDSEEALKAAVADLQAAIDGLKEEDAKDPQKPTKPGKGDDDKDGNGGATVDPDDKDKDKDGDNKLPATATTIFNFLGIGLVLLLIGGALVLVKRKSEKA